MLVPQNLVFASEAVANTEQANNKVLAGLERQAGDNYNNEDAISLILQINDETMATSHGLYVPKIENLKYDAGLEAQISYANEAREMLYKVMDERGLSYTVTETYDTVLNGVAIDTTYGDALVMATLQEIASIEVDRILQAPDIKGERIFTTFDMSSNLMVNVEKAWTRNYTGKGQLIAVIDSGTDVNHEIFNNFDAEGAKLASEEEVNEIINTKHTAKGKYFSEKIPFGYNYADRNLKIKEGNEVSHGMHVAGIIAANKVSRSGAQIEGIAPDSQLAIMRVFGGGMFGGGTTAAIYNKAIDDAVKLGADSINMSLGGTAGTDSRLEETTRAALKNAQKAGIVVAIAAGNDGFMGFGVLKGPNPANPSYGLISDPSVADISMSVASVDNTEVREKGINIEYSSKKIMFAPTDDKRVPVDYLEFVDVGYGYPIKDYGDSPKKKSSLVEEEKTLNEESESNKLDVEEVNSSSVSEPEEILNDLNDANVEEATLSLTSAAATKVLAEEEAKKATLAREEDLKRELEIKKEEELKKELEMKKALEKKTGKDLTGKIALIKRGWEENYEENEADGKMSFYKKVKAAQDHGAALAIVYNNVPGEENFSMAFEKLEAEKIYIPSLFISYEDGEYLKNHPELRLQVSPKDVLIQNAGGGGLSNFSTWGLTEEGNIKPDISGPGGKIFSSINNSRYKVMSGTSMATPHVAGGIAIVKQYVERKFPYVSGAEKHQLVKNIMMSTATPYKFSDYEGGRHGSPRGQGAGLMNLNAATSTDVVVLGTNGVSSISLGDVSSQLEDEQLTVSATLKNYGDKDRTFKYHGELNTDQVDEENNSITLIPEAITNAYGGEITVGAGDTVDFSLSFDISEAKQEELKKEMINGFFLEGYVFFDQVNGGTDISVPFVGFSKDWEELNVVEPSIYDLLEAGKRPTYYRIADKVEDPFTYMGTLIQGDKFASLGKSVDSTFDNPIFEKEHIAFSPNGDSNGDEAFFVGTFLRNYKNLGIEVFRKGNESFPIYTNNTSFSGQKNYYKPTFFGEPDFNQSSKEWAWNGKSANGQAAPEGDYIFKVHVEPDGESDFEQYMSLPIKLDITYPRVVRSSYDAASHEFNLLEVEETGSGVKEAVIVVPTKKGKDGKKLTFKEENGVFKLRSDIRLDEAILKITDYAFNTMELPLDKAIKDGNERMLIVKSVLDSGIMPKDSFKYEIKDSNGNIVEDHYDMEVGSYILTITKVSEDYELVSDKNISFEIKASDKDKVINIKFRRKGKGRILINVTNNDMAKFRLFVINKQNGDEYELSPTAGVEASLYNGSYVTFVPNGKYKIDIRDLDEDKYFATGDREIIGDETDQLGTGNAMRIIDIAEKYTGKYTVKLDRGSALNRYEGKVDITLLADTFARERFDYTIPAGKDEIGIEVPKFIDFKVYTSGYEDENYGSAIFTHTFKYGQEEAIISIQRDVHSGEIYLDKDLLHLYIKQGLALKESDYVLETWEVFEKALYDAQKLDANKMAKQKEINAMTLKLKEAIDGLVEFKGGASKAEWAAKIAEAEEILYGLDDTYTDGSREFLEAAITGAKIAYASDEEKFNTPEYIEQSIMMLDRAIDNLTKKDGSFDMSSLEYLMKKAKNILDNKDDYEADGMDLLELDYDITLEAMEAGEINTKALMDSYKAYLIADLGDIVSKADRTALQKEVDLAKATNLLEYELDCRADYRKARKSAELVLEDKLASQAQVDEALAKLKEARKLLYKIGDEKPVPEDSNDPNTGDESGENTGDKANEGDKPNGDKEEKADEYGLKVGQRYRTRVELYHETKDDTSMGDGAFENNRDAYITKIGDKYKLEFTSNPIEFNGVKDGLSGIWADDSYISGIINTDESTVDDLTYVSKFWFYASELDEFYDVIIAVHAMPESQKARLKLDLDNLEETTDTAEVDTTSGGGGGLGAKISDDKVPESVSDGENNLSVNAKTNIEGNKAEIRIDSDKLGKKIRDLNKSDKKNFVVNANVKEKVDTVELKMKMDDVNKIEENKASISLVTENLIVLIPNDTLDSIKEEKGVHFSIFVSKDEADVDVEVRVGDKLILDFPGELFIQVKDESIKSDQVLVALDANGEESVIRKSITEDGRLRFKLDKDVKTKLRSVKMDFDDVRSKDWFKDAVQFVYGQQLFKGTSEDKFSPNETLTRAMLVTVLHRLNGTKGATESKFSDVAGDSWYYDAVNWAVSEGIVEGEDGKFAPDRNVTRQEIAVMLYRSAKAKKPEKYNMKDFKDSKDIAPWAKDAMQWCVDNGIFKGNEGKLNPKDEASRAESSILMRRMIEMELAK